MDSCEQHIYILSKMPYRVQMVMELPQLLHTLHFWKSVAKTILYKKGGEGGGMVL